MTAERSEPWRLWILLSPLRGIVGREIRYGWSTIEGVRQYADSTIGGLNLRAEHKETGERWHRIAGTWSQAAARPAEPPPRRSQLLPIERRWWEDD
jgi:hypothetical protein